MDSANNLLYSLNCYIILIMEVKIMLLKNCRYIVTQNKNRTILQNYDVLIDGNRILKVGKNLNAGAKIDCSKKIVMPGLVNTHTHLGMHSLRGMNDESELFEWLKSLKEQEQKMGAKKVKENTAAGLIEAVRFGTTTIYDSYKFPNERTEEFEKLGVRGVISSTVKDKKSLQQSQEFLKSNKAKLVKGAIAANSIYSCEEEILQKVVEYSDKHSILRRIHVGETRSERFDTFKKTGKLAIEYLDSLGFLSSNSLLVHCIWITKGEIKRIANANAKVAHNPVSNMKLASGGVMPLVEMLREHISVGLGTDGVASNNNLDMFEEMKMCALLHKHHKWDPKAISAQKVLDMATIDGAQCLGFGEIGSIEQGKLADIITLEIGANMTPVNDVVSNIVYAANGFNTSDVIIDGKTIMQNRQFTK